MDLQGLDFRIEDQGPGLTVPALRSKVEDQDSGFRFWESGIWLQGLMCSGFEVQGLAF